MDPNANLKEQAEIIRHLASLAPIDGYRRRDSRNSRRRELAYLRAQLTDWLHRGGCAPDWTAYPTAARYFNHFRDNTGRIVYRAD